MSICYIFRYRYIDIHRYRLGHKLLKNLDAIHKYCIVFELAITLVIYDISIKNVDIELY